MIFYIYIYMQYYIVFKENITLQSYYMLYFYDSL